MSDSIREQSLINISKKYDRDPEHSHQVKKIALLLFDKTRGILHDFSDNERALLEAGTLLHDIGYYISDIKHHKNSAKLIKEEIPAGFTDEEIEIIANIARYHRGKNPKEKHKSYEALSESSKNITRKLSAIGRLADALDRSHLSLINDLDCRYDSFSRTLFITLNPAIPDCPSELNRAQEKKGLFEEEFLVEVKFKIEQEESR